jgi:3-vinyl bacteriochlorophyllide hydratase
VARVYGSNPKKEALSQHSERISLGVPLDVPGTSHHRDAGVSIHLYNAPQENVAVRAKDIRKSRSPSYTEEQRRRRDATRWTLVQGILAPVQFVVFLASLALVIRYLASGEGYALATASVVVKTMTLYAIMITGSIWEREVFGCYLFAPAFYWEDVFSFLVLALHTAYLGALLIGLGDPRQQMMLALAAYATYVVNATQFVLKLRAARLDERSASANVAGSRA